MNHPNILTIYEVGDSDQGQFIAAEFVDGETLRIGCPNAAHLERWPRSPTQIASALATAHAAGIVHRDIKPENTMIRRDGIVKVLDFGLAKLVEPVASNPGDEPVTRTRPRQEPGLVMGTAVYMSPEQARGLAVDTRTDVFGLGVVLYEMIRGMPAIRRAHMPTSFSRRCSATGSRRRWRGTRANVPAELERIVQKALRKNREERYQHIGDLLIDLQEPEAAAGVRDGAGTIRRDRHH